MSAKYKSPSFLLPNEINTNTNPLNTDGDPATGTGVNSLYSMDIPGATPNIITVDGLTTILRQLDTITISFWYYPKSSGGGAYMFNTGTNNGNGSFCIERYVRGIRIQWKNSSNTYQNIRTDSATGDPDAIFNVLNKWYHICAVLDTTNSVATDKLQIWVNGVRNTSGDKTLTGSGFGTSTSNNVTIGASQTQGNNGGSRMGELAIFNKALTSTEIAALYGGTSPNIYPSNLMATNLNPIAYYPLGEQAQNTGKLPEATVNVWQFPNGVLQDYVMDFDGTNDYIDTNFTRLSGTTAFTLSLWAKTSNTSLDQFLFGNRGTQGVALQTYTGNVSYLYLNPAYFSFSNSSNNISNNTWFNLVLIYDGSQSSNTDKVKLYINGTSVNYSGGLIGNFPSITPTSTENLMIGRDPQSGNEWLGQISNVAIWNTAITDANQIANIYNNGSPQTSYTVTPQNWWKLNTDSVYTPSAPNYTTALDFNGSSDYIDFGNDSSLNISTSSYSISFWIKTDDSGITVISQKANDELAVWINNYKIQWNGANPLSSNSQITGNVWKHVCLVTDSSSSYIYINGAEDATGSTQINSTTSSDNFRIGGRNTQYSYDGQLSNWAIWNTPLTSSQVSTLFNFGTPETTPSFSPQAWWKLDNTTTGIQDSSGNGNNGTNNGATQVNTSVAATPSWKIPSALPITTTPNYTTALDFDGNDYIDCGSSSNLELQTISVSFWIKETQSASSLVGVVGKNIGSNVGWIIWVDANKLIWQVGDGSSNASFSNSTVSNFRSYASLNQWNNICCTFDGTDAKIYINNVLHNIWTPSSPYSIDYTNVGNLNIGKRVDRTTPKLNASLSNVSIFNSTLTASQVSTLYNSGTPETAISFSPVSWWKLDTGGSTITDYGSGGNNGTNNGTATQVTSDVLATQPVNGVSTTLPSTALQQSDLQFDSPYSNYSLSFDGATNYIDCTNYQFSTTKTSISAWFKSSDTRSSEFTEILSKYSDTSAEFQMRLNSNPSGGTTKTLSVFLLQSASTYVTCTTTSTWNDGNWHNVIFTYDSSFASGKLYVDGTLQASDTTTLGVHTPGDANLYIGARQSNSIEKEFLGNIDEVSIWKGTYLSEAQVLEIYNNGKPSNLQNFSGTLPSSWWRLGENAYFDNNAITVPNSISGAPNGVGPGTVVNMLSADAPGTYANGVGTNLDIVDRVGDAPLSTSNSQSYNMIPSDKIPYVPGYVGNQISNTSEMTFNGVDDYFNIGNVSSLNFERTDVFSISAWVKRVGSGTTQFIFSKATNSSPYTGYSIYINPSNQIASNINISYASNHLSVNGNSTLNTSWNHVCVTYDGSSNASGIKLYVNGSEETTSSTGQASITGTLSNSYPVNIAARNSSDLFFNGQIDEVAIFDTALNADQIKFDLYNATTTGKTADIANNPNLPTPVAWYRMGD